MIIITLEIFQTLSSILRVQSQNKEPLLIGGSLFAFQPIDSGIPHEVQSLGASLRTVTLRAKTPTIVGLSIGELACLNSGLIGATVETRLYSFDGSITQNITPSAIYREQVLSCKLSGVDLALTLSTESQPLKFWTN